MRRARRRIDGFLRRCSRGIAPKVAAAAACLGSVRGGGASADAGQRLSAGWARRCCFGRCSTSSTSSSACSANRSGKRRSNMVWCAARSVDRTSLTTRPFSNLSYFGVGYGCRSRALVPEGYSTPRPGANSRAGVAGRRAHVIHVKLSCRPLTGRCRWSVGSRMP